METSILQDVQLQSVELEQLLAVEGGMTLFADITGMPDRSEMCGTMWILDRMIGRMFPSTR